MASNQYFDLPCRDHERHPLFPPHGEALPDGVADAFLDLLFRPPLADAARNGRAFGNEHGVFVSHKRESELHVFSLTALQADCTEPPST